MLCNCWSCIITKRLTRYYITVIDCCTRLMLVVTHGNHMLFWIVYNVCIIWSDVALPVNEAVGDLTCHYVDVL